MRDQTLLCGASNHRPGITSPCMGELKENRHARGGLSLHCSICQRVVGDEELIGWAFQSTTQSSLRRRRAKDALSDLLPSEPFQPPHPRVNR